MLGRFIGNYLKFLAELSKGFLKFVAGRNNLRDVIKPAKVN